MRSTDRENRKLVLALAAALVAGFFLPALAAGERSLTAAVEQVLAMAEAALEEHEPELAESHYHGALLESWLLLGSLEVAEDRLEAARDALRQATRAANTGARVTRPSLALVQLWTGEVHEATKTLRELASERSGHVPTRLHLVQALVLAGEVEEARRELEALRPRAGDRVAELEAALAETEDDPAARRRAFLPRLDLGPLADLPPAERRALRTTIRTTQGLVLRNLGVLLERAGRPERVAELRARADEIDPPVSSESRPETLGRVDLRLAPPPPDVLPLRVDRKTLWQTATVDLLPALREAEAGRLKEAEAILRRVLEEGESAPARDVLAIVLTGQQRFDDAVAELEAALAVSPPLPDEDVLHVHQHLARLHLMPGRESAAADQLRAATRYGQLDRDLALKLAQLELAAGRVKPAEELLLSFVRNYRSPRAFLLLAEIAGQRGDSRAALDFLERAQGLAPSSELVLSRLAEAKAKAK